MNEQSFDALTQRAARGVSRRASLATFGATGLAALAAPFAGEAKKEKRRKKKDKKKDDKKCERQVDQCNGYFVPLCEEEGAPEECAEQIGTCCQFLGSCQAEAFIDCLMTLIRPPEPR